jgi:hypothetical protein
MILYEVPGKPAALVTATVVEDVLVRAAVRVV